MENENKVDGIYTLNEKIGFKKAFPFGIEHAMTMIISNISAIIIILSQINAEEVNTIDIIQNSLFVAGICTIVQVYGLWKIGARLPLVMGTGFAYIAIVVSIGKTNGYGTAIGSCIVGGLIIGILGLFGKFWKNLVSPIVSGLVVLGIGFTLLKVGASSFAGGEGSSDFGSWKNILVGTISLITCLLVHTLGKGMIKELNVLFGIIVGYIFSLILGIVDFSSMENVSVITYPKLVDFSLISFDFASILSILIIYIAGTTDSVGNTYTINKGILNEETTPQQIGGSIMATGLLSSVAALFGAFPLTPYGENVALMNNTKVINKKCFLWCGIIVIIASFFPAIGSVFRAIPSAVIGGSMLMLFGSIIVTGIKMISECKFTNRNLIIISLSIVIGIGLPLVNCFDKAPDIIKSLGNSYIIMIFAVALILDYTLPNKEK